MAIPRLLQLAIDNKTTPKTFNVKSEGDTASVYVYDVIDSYYGVAAQSFVKTLNDIKANTIHLHINSPGGDVFEARAMVAAIQQHKAQIVAHIDGVAASAASYLATACDRVEIVDGAFLMIHNAWSFAMGNAADLRSTAELLDKVDASIVSDYAKKTGKDVEQIQQWMANETWFTSREAVENGFADAVVESGKDSKTKAACNSWNLSAYANAPKGGRDLVDHAANTRARMLALLEK